MDKKNMFISGSIGGRNIPNSALEKIDKAIDLQHTMLVGDARGVDAFALEYLRRKQYKNVEVFFVGEESRNSNLCSEWTRNPISVPPEKKYIKDGKYTREAQYLKDDAMSKKADCGVVVWQDVRDNRYGKKEVSKGSLRNIFHMLRDEKPVFLVYLPEGVDGVKLEYLQQFEEAYIGDRICNGAKSLAEAFKKETGYDVKNSPAQFEEWASEQKRKSRSTVDPITNVFYYNMKDDYEADKKSAEDPKEAQGEFNIGC
jgi:hypothetical protein